MEEAEEQVEEASEIEGFTDTETVESAARATILVENAANLMTPASASKQDAPFDEPDTPFDKPFGGLNRIQEHVLALCDIHIFNADQVEV